MVASNTYKYNDPFLSPYEQRLYFISDQAQEGKGERKDFDICIWIGGNPSKKLIDAVNIVQYEADVFVSHNDGILSSERPGARLQNHPIDAILIDYSYLIKN